MDFQVVQEWFHEDPSRFFRVQHERFAPPEGLPMLQCELMLPLALNSDADFSVDDNYVTDFCMAYQCH